MSLKNRFVQLVQRYGKDFFTAAIKASEKQLRRSTKQSSSTTTRERATLNSADSDHRQQTDKNAKVVKNSRQSAASTANLPAPEGKPEKWDLAKFGLPRLSYTPDNDQLPDPGEVVWTWVPYEEMDGRGKDRPVLVVSMHGEYIIFVQLTSKDHASNKLYQDKFQRWWLDIGTGAWDKEGRPSEARLDLLWVVHASQVRRMGGKLDQAMYAKLAQTLHKIHG